MGGCSSLVQIIMKELKNSNNGRAVEVIYRHPAAESFVRSEVKVYELRDLPLFWELYTMMPHFLIFAFQDN